MTVLAEMISAAAVDEGGYRAWDDMGVEVEVAEFLYGLVRLLKPTFVVESGTGQGYAATALASALQANGHGHLETFEPLPTFQALAASRLAPLPATVNDGYSWEYDGPLPDIVFLDSFGTQRPRDIDFWLPQSVFLVVHDAHEHAQLLPGSGFTVDTPRGLWVRA